jgi:ribonuclease HII
MPWIIGIDEAGYGPNLGPLIMSAVAWQVPADLLGADLWQVLRPAVRRHGEADDGRILVEDSKLVYSTTRGLHALELGVLAALSPFRDAEAVALRQYLDWLCPEGAAELGGEPWYAGDTLLPVVAERDKCGTVAGRLDHVCRQRGVVRAWVQSVVVCPARFNQFLAEANSKGAVLAHGLVQLVASALQRVSQDEGPVHFFVDKHGGRNTYAAMLQHALPEGFVAVEREGMERSVYRVTGLGREVCLTIQPRADAEHFSVALASMVSKYLREVLMREFNRFWQTHVPGLKPTAGYPGDAARFFEVIRPVLPRLGLAEERVWRRK